MTLNEYQRANLRGHLHSADQIRDENGDEAIGASDGSMAVPIDGGGATITTGVKHDLQMPFSGVFYGWSMLGDRTGSIQIDIWKDSYANFPPTDADSITGGAEPEIAANTKGMVDDDDIEWAFSAGDVLRFNVDSVTDLQRVTLSLKYRRTA